MAPKVFDRMMKLLLNVGAGITVALFMWFFNNRDIHAKQLEKKIDSKVDNTEFIEFKEDNKQDHLKLEKDRKEDLRTITDHVDKRFEDFKDFMIELNKK